MQTKNVISAGVVGLIWICLAWSVAAANLDQGGSMDSSGWRAFPTRAAAPASGAKRTSATSSNGWRSLGPFGGDIAAVAASPLVPGLVLAGTKPSGGGGELYRSADGGNTWSRLPAHTGASVYDIEFADDGGIFIATSVGLLYGVGPGTTFSVRDLGIGINQVVLDVHLVGGAASKLWVAVANPFGQQPVALMRSDDGGFVWSNVTPPIAAGLGGTAVAVDPVDSDRVLAAFSADFGGGAVWASTNGGQSWVDRSAGLPPNRPLFTVVHDGSRFLVGGGRVFGGQLVGLYATSDLGAQWTALHDASWPLLAVNEIALDPNQPGVIIAASGGAGVYRSSDGGQSWQFGIGGTGALTVYAARFFPGSSNDLLIGAEAQGVFRTTNAGGSFEPSSSGILELVTTAVSVNPANPQELAVGFSGENSGGVLRSLDGGRSWQAQAVPGTRYSAVAYAADSTLYAISDGPSSIAPEGLYRREANGSWVSLGPDQGPLFESELEVIAFDPQQPQTLLLGGADFGSGNEATIWRSTDGGAQWSKRFEGPVAGDKVIDLEFVGGGAVLAGYDGFGASQTGGMLRSINGGIDWSAANQGLANYARLPHLCRAVDGQIWLSAWRQFGVSSLYRSLDQGANWLTVFPPVGDVRDIGCDPGSAQGVYFVLAQAPWVIRTRDAAASFETWSEGIDSLGFARALVPANGRMLIASPRGVFQSPPLNQVYANGFEGP